MKKYLLPALAIVFVMTAAVVIFAVPRGKTSTAAYARRDVEGNITISASELIAGQLAVFKFSEDSKIELIAALDEEGRVQAALGTCQSCMGSPKAYYTQNGDLLQCNNCGLTFPLSVIGTSGAGCHPILIDASAIWRSSDGITIDAAAISPYEPLFASVAAH